MLDKGTVSKWRTSGEGWKQSIPSGYSSSGNLSLACQVMLVIKTRLASFDFSFMAVTKRSAIHTILIMKGPQGKGPVSVTSQHDGEMTDNSPGVGWVPY